MHVREELATDGVTEEFALLRRRYSASDSIAVTSASVYRLQGHSGPTRVSEPETSCRPACFESAARQSAASQAQLLGFDLGALDDEVLAAMTVTTTKSPGARRGGPVPRERDVGFPGYPGGTAVVGNRVRDQFQLDIFGEALLVFAAAARCGPLPDDCRAAVCLAVEAIAAHLVAPRARRRLATTGTRSPMPSRKLPVHETATVRSPPDAARGSDRGTGRAA
ncbi:hypothetical protein ACFYUD_18590 [Nocardia tengchongensis]|uniref:hypothetical protein n=1 Tax=Nocardia tengchongensis TaxID=2055889 RepID=UPI0036D14BF8